MKEKKQSFFNDFVVRANNKLTDEIYWIFLSILIISLLLYFIANALIAKPNTVDYDSSRFYLFIMICMDYAGSLLVPGVAKQMFDAFRKILKNPKKLTKIDIFFNLLFCGNILASLSFLIMDFSFSRNIGLKFSSVIIVNLFGIFMAYYKKPKKRRK